MDDERRIAWASSHAATFNPSGLKQFSRPTSQEEEMPGRILEGNTSTFQLFALLPCDVFTNDWPLVLQVNGLRDAPVAIRSWQLLDPGSAGLQSALRLAFRPIGYTRMLRSILPRIPCATTAH
jgi:hypothetical protein